MSNETEYPAALDICGYNYTENMYDADHKKYPKRVIYGSENRHDLAAWKAVTSRDFIFGQFLWMLEQGVTHIVPSGARDLRPDETYLPESVYSRVQTWGIGGLSVAYQALGVPRSVVYAHMTGITVDGHPGLIDPAAR